MLKEYKYSIYIEQVTGGLHKVSEGKTRLEALQDLSDLTGYSTSTLNCRLLRIPGVKVRTRWNIKEIILEEASRTAERTNR